MINFDGVLYHKDTLSMNMTNGIIVTIGNFYDEQTCLQTVYTPDSINKITEEQVQKPTKEGYVFNGWVNEDGEKVTFPIYIGSDDDLHKVPIDKGDIFNIYATWEVHNHQWNLDEWNYDEVAHWHECLAEGCPITENSQKDGYAVNNFEGKEEVVIEPKCYEPGLKLVYCTLEECGAYEERIIEKIPHDYENITVINDIFYKT